MQSEIDLCLSDMERRQDDVTLRIASRIKSYRTIPPSRFGIPWRRLAWRLRPDARIRKAAAYNRILGDDDGWCIKVQPFDF
jgi:hypothetical protein